jgi:hypothetical protein
MGGEVLRVRIRRNINCQLIIDSGTRFKRHLIGTCPLRRQISKLVYQ